MRSLAGRARRGGRRTRPRVRRVAGDRAGRLRGARRSSRATRRDQLPEEGCLASGRGAERAQVPRVDAVARRAARRPRRRRRRIRVALLGDRYRGPAGRSPRAPSRARGRSRRARRARRGRSAPPRAPSRPAAALRSACAGRVELVAESPATAGTRRAAAAGSSEPLEVGLAEQAVAAPRALRRRAAPRPPGTGSSRSRCPGTPRQPPHDLADAKEPLTARSCGVHQLRRARHAMNVMRYLPTCSSSPSVEQAHCRSACG